MCRKVWLHGGLWILCVGSFPSVVFWMTAGSVFVVWQWVLERSDEQKKTADRSIVPFGVVPVCWLKPDLWLASSWRRMMVETSSFSAGCSDSSSPVGSEVQLRWKKLLMINTVKIFLIHTLKIRLWCFICSNYISDAMDKNDVYSYVGHITSSSFLTVAPFFDAKSPSEADVAFVPGSSRCCVS